jgi:hypothetical protein
VQLKVLGLLFYCDDGAERLRYIAAARRKLLKAYLIKATDWVNATLTMGCGTTLSTHYNPQKS